jgi:GNAT superfamily N-acetyltransferase
MTNDKYQLVQLTDLKDIESCHTINFVEWANGLSRDQYLIREKGVKLKLSQDDMNLTYWALQEKQETGEWKLVSAFESVSRPALYKKKGQPVDKTISHSIGSVFTAKEHRGKGYAREMMARGLEKLTHHDDEHFNKEQRKEAVVALWSDIKDYYAQFGYKKEDTHEIKIKLTSQTSGVVSHSWPTQVRPIKNPEEIVELAKRAEKQLVEDMDKKTEEDGITRVAIAPRPAVFAHTHWRSQYVGPILTKGPEKGVPEVFGAHCGKTNVLWAQDYGSEKIYLLRTITDRDASAEQVTSDLNLILQAALNEAQKWGLEYICLWTQDVPEVTSLEKVHEAFVASQIPSVDAIIHDRPDSWPMYCVPNDPDRVDWISNGKYAWF